MGQHQYLPWAGRLLNPGRCTCRGRCLCSQRPLRQAARSQLAASPGRDPALPPAAAMPRRPSPSSALRRRRSAATGRSRSRSSVAGSRRAVADDPVDGFPVTLREWLYEQHTLFEGYPPLPGGWIRVWSRSVNQPYYVYLLCNPPITTADLRDVLRPVPSVALPGGRPRPSSL